jgi:hypothetical protein
MKKTKTILKIFAIIIFIITLISAYQNKWPDVFGGIGFLILLTAYLFLQRPRRTTRKGLTSQHPPRTPKNI